MPDNSGAVDLGALSPEEQQAVRDMAAQQPDEEETGPKPATTGFSIVIVNGLVNIGPYEGDTYEIERSPTDDEVYGAVTTVAKDIQVKEGALHTAHQTVALQMQQAQAMQERFQAAQMEAQLGDLRRG